VELALDRAKRVGALAARLGEALLEVGRVRRLFPEEIRLQAIDLRCG